MDAEDFRDSPCGKLVSTLNGARAYLPDPLPPRLNLEPVIPLLVDASRHLGELRGIGRTLQNPLILVRTIQRREAVASSKIEGTVTSISDLLLFEAGADRKARPPDTREVLNYVEAFEHAVLRLKELPFCLRLIREIHEILLKDTDAGRGGNTPPGEFRRDQNWIGPENSPISAARFVPPPPNEVMSCLDQFEKYVQTKDDSEIPLLVQLALIHYQFETIHPFPDGNGRVGRLIIPLILMEKGELPHPLLHLSPYFEANRDQYVDHLFKVSRSGSWIEWIRFFLQGVIVQCHDTIVRVQRLQDLQTGLRERLLRAGRSARTIQLADYLFERPVITIPHAQRILDVTYPSAAYNVKQLSDAKILTQLPEFSQPKYFISDEIFSVLYADEIGEIH